MFFDDWLIEPDSVLVLIIVLHEKHVAHVQAPNVVVTTKLDRLAEYLFDGSVVLHLPVDARLSHQNRNVSAQKKSQNNRVCKTL